jgi:hypothetical protein
MYGGIFDTIESIASTFGIGSGSATAVAQAYASPTIANINAVTAAFQAEGNSPPPELMNSLWQRYYQAIASNPALASGSLTTLLSNPIVLIGGAALLFFVLSKKRKA